MLSLLRKATLERLGAWDLESVEISHLFISQLPAAVGLEGVDWAWLPFGFLFAQNLGDGKHSVKHRRRKGGRSFSCESKSGILFKHNDVSIQGHVTAPLP